MNSAKEKEVSAYVYKQCKLVFSFKTSQLFYCFKLFYDAAGVQSESAISEDQSELLTHA